MTTPLRQAIKLLLRSSATFEISIFAILTIRRLESQLFAVWCENAGEEIITANIDEALDQFFKWRETYKIGADYEEAMRP